MAIECEKLRLSSSGQLDASMFVLAVFVILIDVIVSMVEKRLLVWKPVAGEGRG